MDNYSPQQVKNIIGVFTLSGFFLGMLFVLTLAHFSFVVSPLRAVSHLTG